LSPEARRLQGALVDLDGGQTKPWEGVAVAAFNVALDAVGARPVIRTPNSSSAAVPFVNFRSG
jgi:hypothetical protein